MICFFRQRKQTPSPRAVCPLRSSPDLKANTRNTLMELDSLPSRLLHFRPPANTPPQHRSQTDQSRDARKGGCIIQSVDLGPEPCLVLLLLLLAFLLFLVLQHRVVCVLGRLGVRAHQDIQAALVRHCCV